MTNAPSKEEELTKIHKYWQAANYLFVGQIYLWQNPFIKRTVDFKACKAAAPGALGNHARS